MVDDAREMSPPENVWSEFHVFTLVVAGKRPVTASRARGSVKYKLVFSVTSRVEAEPRTVVPLIFKTPESEAREREFAKRFVVEAAVRRTVPKVLEAEFKFWMVDEPRVMREFGILTSPFAFTRKSEDVPEHLHWWW